MSLAIADTLGFLLGDWSIERVITDHRAGASARFSGVARVEAADTGAGYFESGRLTRGGHVGEARRALSFVDRGDGTVRVDFPDGHRFLDLDLAAGSCRAVHPCRADSYEMGFEVLSHDAIRETWRVTGPKKDYVAETVWRRLEGPPSSATST